MRTQFSELVHCLLNMPCIYMSNYSQHMWICMIHHVNLSISKIKLTSLVTSLRISPNQFIFPTVFLVQDLRLPVPKALCSCHSHVLSVTCNQWWFIPRPCSFPSYLSVPAEAPTTSLVSCCSLPHQPPGNANQPQKLSFSPSGVGNVWSVTVHFCWPGQGHHRWVLK